MEKSAYEEARNDKIHAHTLKAATASMLIRKKGKLQCSTCREILCCEIFGVNLIWGLIGGDALSGCWKLSARISMKRCWARKQQQQINTRERRWRCSCICGIKIFSLTLRSHSLAQNNYSKDTVPNLKLAISNSIIQWKLPRSKLTNSISGKALPNRVQSCSDFPFTNSHQLLFHRTRSAKLTFLVRWYWCELKSRENLTFFCVWLCGEEENLNFPNIHSPFTPPTGALSHRESAHFLLGFSERALGRTIALRLQTSGTKNVNLFSIKFNTTSLNQMSI